MRHFHISDILSVITGKMVSIRNVEGIHDLLSFMTDDPIQIHQIPRVMDECKPFLEEQFPELEKISLAEINDSNLLQIMAGIESEYDSYYLVEKLPEGAHKRINPIAEMFMTRKEHVE